LLRYSKISGWEVPTDTLPCWYISETERIRSLQEKKSFYDYRPSCYFKIVKRLENNFIEGHLGHNSFDGLFHSNITSTYTYFENYEKRIPVYFSFDRVTLYKLIEILPGRVLTFTLKRIDNPKAIQNNMAFMIMPFGDIALNQFYLKNIKPFLKKELSIDIYRADDINGNDIIIDTIYQRIEESEFIVAETSKCNKNVFYEFGYAAAKEKEIITIQDEKIEKQLFFDRTHIRAIFYSRNKIKAFQERLKNDITSIRQKIESKN
jgi:hypothetical protein